MKTILQRGYTLFALQIWLCRIMLLFQVCFSTLLFSQQGHSKDAGSGNVTVSQHKEAASDGVVKISGSEFITVTGDAFIYIQNEKKEVIKPKTVAKKTIAKATPKKKDPFFKKKSLAVVQIKTAQPKTPSLTISNPSSKENVAANSSFKKNTVEVKSQYSFLYKEGVELFTADLIYRDLFSLEESKFSKNLPNSLLGRAPPSIFLG